MKRRDLLVSAVSCLALAGCSSDDGMGYPSEGSALASVTVNESFDGTVELDASCRGEQYSIASGEEFSLERTKKGEECTVDLRVDGRVAATEVVSATQGAVFEVDTNGTVDAREWQI